MGVVELLLDNKFLDPRRLRVTGSVTTVPDHLKGKFKTCSTARLMLATEHPDIETGLYLDLDTYVASDLTEPLDEIKSFNSTQWCGMVQETEAFGQHGNWYLENNTQGTYYKP